MENDCTKCFGKICFDSRKNAAVYNDKLNGREYAAEMLGISPSTLANHELGTTKKVPVDTVVMMADLYNSPELKTLYCSSECPIRGFLPAATEVRGLEGIALRIIREFDPGEVESMKKDLVDITADGKISESEKPVLKNLLERLENMAMAISELKLVGEKCLRK